MDVTIHKQRHPLGRTSCWSMIMRNCKDLKSSIPTQNLENTLKCCSRYFIAPDRCARLMLNNSNLLEGSSSERQDIVRAALSCPRTSQTSEYRGLYDENTVDLAMLAAISKCALHSESLLISRQAGRCCLSLSSIDLMVLEKMEFQIHERADFHTCCRGYFEPLHFA